MQFLLDHYDEILALLGTLYALVSGIVALTPSREDDRFLARAMQRVSFLAPRNSPQRFSLPGAMPRKEDDRGASLLVALLCFAPLLGGCAGAKVPIEDARAVACIAVERSFMERDDAELRIAITRAVCDELHRRLVGE